MSENNRMDAFKGDRRVREAGRRAHHDDPPVGSIIKNKHAKKLYDYDYLFLGRTPSGNVLASPYGTVTEIFNPMTFELEL